MRSPLARAHRPDRTRRSSTPHPAGTLRRRPPPCEVRGPAPTREWHPAAHPQTPPTPCDVGVDHAKFAAPRPPPDRARRSSTSHPAGTLRRHPPPCEVRPRPAPAARLRTPQLDSAPRRNPRRCPPPHEVGPPHPPPDRARLISTSDPTGTPRSRPPPCEVRLPAPTAGLRTAQLNVTPGRHPAKSTSTVRSPPPRSHRPTAQGAAQPHTLRTPREVDLRHAKSDGRPVR
jgi:hypothetical protein